MLRPQCAGPACALTYHSPSLANTLGSKQLLGIVCQAITGPEAEPQTLLYTTLPVALLTSCFPQRPYSIACIGFPMGP